MPLFEIKSWFDGRVLFSLECASLKICVEAAVKAKADLRAADLRAADLRAANLSDADLRAADLRAANLRAADLSAANLRAADLRAADLSDADLRAADLSDADLSAADLRAANLRAADLSDADLRAADLSDADLSDATILPTQETWKQYISDVVPALLQAGGKALEALAESFNCHSWSNCPMAVAFGIHDPSSGPPLLQPRIRQFVQFFDAKLIEWPMISPKAAKAAGASH